MNDDDESLLTYLAGMDARIDRLEGQLEKALTALATLTEIGLLTYGPVGPKLRFWPSRRTFWERGIRY